MSTAEARWQARIARARHLAGRHAAAAEALMFYAALAGTQADLLAEFARPSSDPPRPGRALAPLIPRFVARLAGDAPPAVAARLDAIALDERWSDLLETYWTSGGRAPAAADPADLFVAEALIQPFAEVAAARAGARAASRTASPHTPVACPACSALPLATVLREAGHGARRSLVCGLCFTEWPALRLICPSCGETGFDRLPVYRADDLDAARIDACDACQTYLKTIDLTRDGAAVPPVDDVATLSLDLWARERGYRRLRPNVLWI